MGERPAVKSGLIDILFAAAMDEGSAEKKVELFPPRRACLFYVDFGFAPGFPSAGEGSEWGEQESERGVVDALLPSCVVI